MVLKECSSSVGASKFGGFKGQDLTMAKDGYIIMILKANF